MLRLSNFSSEMANSVDTVGIIKITGYKHNNIHKFNYMAPPSGQHTEYNRKLALLYHVHWGGEFIQIGEDRI